MDIYQIMARLDAISSKKTLTESQGMAQPVDEGQMKRSLETRAEQMSKAAFVANAGEYGMSDEEAAEFWTAVNGEEEVDEAHEKLPVDQLGLDKFSQAALSGGQRKRDALANPNQTRMLAKKSAQQQPVREAGEAFAKGDRVMYNNTFATVVGQDGDAYIVKVDKQPNTMKVPATAIKKPSYNEGAAEGDDSVLPLLKKFISKKSDPADRQDLIKVYRAFQQGITQGFETLSNQWGTNLDAEFYHFAKQQGVDLNSIARKHGVLKDSVAESKKSKPDFLDMDKDGDKKEPMKKAVKDKNDAKGSFQKQMGGSANDLTKGLSVKSKSDKDLDESALQAYLGKKKYGPEGMKALQQAGRDGAGKEKMAKIRARHDKMDEAEMDEGNKFAHNVLKAKAAGIKKADLDGDGDMETVREMFPGTPEYELRFGKDDASSAFDKKKISTGTVYSRKHHEEPEADDDAPRAAGRPKGSKRRLGAKGPGVDSKLLKGKGGLKEGDIDIVDRGEYDREGDMALSQVHQIADAARELHAILGADDNLPEWVQAKITKALDYIDTARDYLGAEEEMDREELPEIAPIVGALAGRALAGAAGAGSTGQAIGSLAGRAVAGAMNSNDEVEEAGYSAKAARAGKDIGKPGKNFSKIAKGAAERYGSKAAGERVAGAVLNKLRAKEGVEEGPDTGIGSKLPKSDIETFGLQKGRPYKINPPQDFKPGDRKRAVQQLIPTQDKKDHIRSRLGKHVAPVLPEQDVEEESTNKKDVPFDGPYRKKDDDKDQFGNKIKHVAQHAARKGLADITTAALKAELKRRSQVEEESTDTKDQHAEKAGKKVAKDIEHDEGHKGRDDAKAEKAGKKVTKDIEYDDKKDKEKKVDETTVSGSVATGGDAPKKSKGGMQFGQGVYEGAIAESFNKKLGGILTEGMSVNVSTDDTGKKSITVNATDADADSLGNMLKMAGLFSSEGYSRTCEHCHGIHEAGACQAEQVAEELANSPNEVYADKDYMTQTLAGGLNGPKTTGQTTGPVINRQDNRQGVMAEAERVVEQSETRLWNLYKQYDKK